STWPTTPRINSQRRPSLSPASATQSRIKLPYKPQTFFGPFFVTTQPGQSRGTTTTSPPSALPRGSGGSRRSYDGQRHGELAFVAILLVIHVSGHTPISTMSPM